MYRVAVCDDEQKVREKVNELIHKWNPSVLVDSYASGEELVGEGIANGRYQAVFLDIDMENMDGIETGRRIRLVDRNVKIIYLTAYRDYVAGAFGVHAFQYLLKPVKEKEIFFVLEEVFRYSHAAERGPVLDFQTVQGLVCLPVSDIFYFEYVQRGVEIVAGTDKYRMVEKIGTVAERMKNYGFSMPHQSFVVNMLHVKNVQAGRIFLDNGMEIPVALKKQKTWKEELVVYLSKRLEEGR